MLDPKQLQAIDAPLVALTQHCRGDLRQLMHAFFSFLNRRTDFYLVPHPDDKGKNSMGFAEGDAEKMLIAAFRQFPLRRIPKGGIPSKGSPPAKPKAASAKAASSQKDNTKNPEASPKQKAQDKKGEGEIAKTKSPKSNDNDKEDEKTVPPNMRGVRYNEEGLQIPIGNGGSTPRYKWTQTIDETTVMIGVPETFRGKDFDVSITASKLSVRAKKCLEGDTTPITFVEGKLVDNIRVDESTWTIEGGVMTVTLDKMKKKFWTTVYEDDIEKYKIDTELVDSRRHIDEYDDSTQAAFRKAIFDQNQYHLNGPSSDEILGKTKQIPGLPQDIKSIDNTPELPPGVEFIDQKTIDAATPQGKK